MAEFSSSDGQPAVKGTNDNPTPAAGVGVHGVSRATGVLGESVTWHGVVGFSQAPTGFGVFGKSAGAGVVGESTTWHGVGGFSDSTTGGCAVYAEHKANGTALLAKTQGGLAVWAESRTNEAIHAETHSTQTAAIAAYNAEPNSDAAALYAKKEGSRGFAGFFEGNVFVRGVIDVDHLRVRHADFAEEFAVCAGASCEPGTVMVLNDGIELAPCTGPYDNRVAGVISGAGTYRPGVLLDRQPHSGRQPIALLGKVFCRVDADLAPVRAGDLLTTSATPGHAMKVRDRERALGAIVGKALEPLASGRALIPILITLL